MEGVVVESPYSAKVDLVEALTAEFTVRKASGGTLMPSVVRASLSSGQSTRLFLFPAAIDNRHSNTLSDRRGRKVDTRSYV